MKQKIVKTEELTIIKNVSDAPKKIERPNTDKKITESSNENFGNLFMGKSAGPPQNLNAKKIDVNFDCDDFFNQFDPTAIAQKPVAKKVESTPVPVISDSDSGIMKFGNNVPILENKPKSNLDEYNSKKQTY
jgi:hypothetical protein